MAGEHGTEDGKGVEEEAGGGLDQQPDGQRLQIQTVPHSLAGQGEAKDGGVGQQQEAEPGQIVGEKQSLPPQGQGVHHAGGAAGIQIAEHRHSGQQAKDDGQHRAQVQGVAHRDPGKIVQAVRKVLQSPVLPPLDRGEQIEGQGKQPDHRVQGPDGPEAAEVFAVEGGIKA